MSLAFMVLQRAGWSPVQLQTLEAYLRGISQGTLKS